MVLKQNIRRLLLLPFGFVRGLFSIANNMARDIENQKRFPKSIIESGSSFSATVRLGATSRICNNCTVNNSTIGKYTYVNYRSVIENSTIGNYCSIAHGVKIGLGAHPIHLFSTSPIFYKVKNALGVRLLEKDVDFKEYQVINIGHDVWVGANAIIMDGVTIGNGAVIAAGAVVTKNVPAYAIVGGVPAKVIKFRFDQNKIQELLKSKWWELAPNEVKF